MKGGTSIVEVSAAKSPCWPKPSTRQAFSAEIRASSSRWENTMPPEPIVGGGGHSQMSALVRTRQRPAAYVLN